MRYAFDFIVRTAGSRVIEAKDEHEAKIKLQRLISTAAGGELVDFEIVHTTSGLDAAITDLNDLKKAIINRR